MALDDLVIDAPLVTARAVPTFSTLGVQPGLAGDFGTSWGRIYAADQGGSFTANRGRLIINGAVVIEGGSLAAANGVTRSRRCNYVVRRCARPGHARKPSRPLRLVVVRPMLQSSIRHALAVAACAMCVGAAAQTPPVRDEGRQLLEQQRAREREERLLQETPTPQGTAPAQLPSDFASPDDVADAEPLFLIERIALKGNSLLADNDVRALINPFIGKRLGVNRINLLLRRLTRAYIDRGYITTRVYLGRQNLASGALDVTVVQGTIEDIRINGEKPKSERGLRLAFPTGREQILRLQDLEQGIDQLNRLPSNSAELQIGPGEEPGSSIVNINNQPQSRFRGVVGADNYGQDVTGQGRLRLGLEADNVLGLYESYGLTYVGSRDTNAVLLSSSLPVGYNTFSYNYYYSEFVNVIADTAVLFGRSQGHTFAWNRVLERGPSGKSSVDMSLGLRESRRDVNDIELTPQRLAVLRVGANRLQRFSRGFVLVDGGVSTGLERLRRNHRSKQSAAGRRTRAIHQARCFAQRQLAAQLPLHTVFAARGSVHRPGAVQLRTDLHRRREHRARISGGIAERGSRRHVAQ